MDPEQWRDTLDYMAASLNCIVCDFYLIHEGNVAFNTMGNGPREVSDKYIEYCQDRSDLLQARIHQHECAKYDTELSAANNTLHRKYCDYFINKWDSVYTVCHRIFDHDAKPSFVALQLVYEDDAMEEHVNKLVKYLIPHLKRAAQIQLRLPEAERKQLQTTGALDFIYVGIVILNNRGDVETLNNAADRIIEHFGGLSIINKRLYPHDSRERVKLEQLLSYALSGNPASKDGYGAMTLSSPHRAMPVNILVAPLPRSGNGTNGPDITVFITDPLTPEQPNIEALLRAWFGLTPAESKLAAILIDGKNLRTYAEGNGIAYETARFTLKKILKKTGTCSQAELVSLIFKSTPQIDLFKTH